MSAAAAFSIVLTTWQAAEDALRGVRHAVFVVEQHVPESLEWDDADVTAVHAVAHDSCVAPIGCARLLPDGHIGRVAVMRPWRGRGVGSALVCRLVDQARRTALPNAILNAQVAALPFYQRLGFVPTGDVFEEAGIDHRVMTLALR